MNQMEVSTHENRVFRVLHLRPSVPENGEYKKRKILRVSPLTNTTKFTNIIIKSTIKDTELLAEPPDYRKHQ